jgi:processive 1,2-diacylglycerol beta-glucosyltransferase
MSASQKPLKVLILYTKVGGGHESIAYGLSERLQEYFSGRIEVMLEDPTNNSTDLAYQLSTAVSPDLFNQLSKLVFNPSVTKLWRGLQSFIHEEKLAETIRTTNPDLIISTYFLLTEEVKKVLRDEGKSIPLVVYIADPFTPHPIWLVREVDLYISFDREHLPQTKKFPNISDTVIPIGMPIRKAFYKKYDRSKTLSSIHLDPEKFTIFFGGSGSGMDQLERIAQRYKEELSSGSQALFFTGRNGVLKQALKLLFRNCRNVHIFGYLEAEEVAAFMQASDVFVGKVGPNAMFETVLSGVVPIATPPILEQEKGNRSFIEKEKIGFLTKNTSETINLLKKFMTHRDILQEYQTRMKNVRENLLKKESNEFPKFITWVEKACSLS